MGIPSLVQIQPHAHINVLDVKLLKAFIRQTNIWSIQKRQYNLVQLHRPDDNAKVVIMVNESPSGGPTTGLTKGTKKTYTVYDKRTVLGRTRNVYKSGNKLFVKSKGKYVGLREFTKMKKQ